MHPCHRRILVIDDNRAIHDDFRKILLGPAQTSRLDDLESALFDVPAPDAMRKPFEMDFAFQGQDGLEAVRKAMAEGRPYSLAFVDVRMPPGRDGIETAAKLWEASPDLQIIICTAYSDYSWDDIIRQLGQSDRLLILKKPFDPMEVLQTANALSEKWKLLQLSRLRMDELDRLVNERTAQLSAEIEERKRVEATLRESQEMILRQERLAAVGQIAAGVAHDFNNIMTVIQGHAGLLRMRKDLPSTASESLERIESAVRRASKLTRQLLAFSRKQAMQPRHVDMAQVLHGMDSMLRRVLGEHISMQLEAAPGLHTVFGDPNMLEQGLMNLAVNAADAMPEGGELTLTLGPVEIAESEVESNLEARPGRFIRLSVRDTGCGMEKAVLGRIFEPFFTTKEVGKGTGLGLSTAYGIVKQHDGWMHVESELGRGSCFHLYLPAVDRPAELPAPALEPAPAPITTPSGRGETILIVEDEAALRFVVRRVILRLGYQVLEAASGREALRVWESNKQNIALLLTDIIMPEGLSGKQLARTLCAEKPDLKVIFTTGYDNEASDRHTRLIAGANLLRKPYPPSELATMLQRAFNSTVVAPVPVGEPVIA